MSTLPDQTCPECGEVFRHVEGAQGRPATYCSRSCQVRNLNRRRSPLTVRLTFERGPARHALERAAIAANTTPTAYLEELVSRHLADLDVSSSGYADHMTDHVRGAGA